MFKRLILLTIFVCLLVPGIAACGGSGNASSNTNDNSANTANTTPTVASTQAASPTTATGPLQVSGIAMAVTPSSLSSVTCGTTTNLVFSAAISVSESTGGVLPYTWNLGSTHSSGTVTFAAGQTSKIVSYTASGITVQFGSAMPSATLTAGSGSTASTSSSVKPAGNCSLPGPFTVVSITLSLTPTSLAGIACNSSISVVYTATITIGPNSNAGTVNLTWNVGTFHPTTSVVFAPLQTVRTITYTEPGKLVAHNTNGFPRVTSLSSTSPNALTSSSLKPTGACH